MIEVVLFIGIPIVAGMIANSKGRSVGGWVILGLFFSIFAVIAVAILPAKVGIAEGVERETK